jgi:hypothetical protein
MKSIDYRDLKTDLVGSSPTVAPWCLELGSGPCRLGSCSTIRVHSGSAVNLVMSGWRSPSSCSGSDPPIASHGEPPTAFGSWGLFALSTSPEPCARLEEGPNDHLTVTTRADGAPHRTSPAAALHRAQGALDHGRTYRAAEVTHVTERLGVASGACRAGACRRLAAITAGKSERRVGGARGRSWEPSDGDVGGHPICSQLGRPEWVRVRGSQFRYNV